MFEVFQNLLWLQDITEHSPIDGSVDRFLNFHYCGGQTFQIERGQCEIHGRQQLGSVRN